MRKKVLHVFAGIIVLAAFSGALVLGGCGEDERDNTRIAGRDVRTIKDDVNFDKSGNVKPERDISPMEMDTLRAQKKRHNITREEYWDDRGGVLGNEYLELWYGIGKLTVTHGMYAFNLIAQAREDFRRTFGRVPEDRLTVVCSVNLQEYDKLVGREWWHYSRIEKDKITYQPIPILFQRRLLDMAVPREYYEWGIGELSDDRAPHWFKEGLASVLSEEGDLLEKQLMEFTDHPIKMDMETIESALKKEVDRKQSRIAYYNTFRMVENMVDNYGIEKVVNAVTLMGEGDKVKSAFEKSFQEPYDDVIKKAMEFTVER